MVVCGSPFKAIFNNGKKMEKFQSIQEWDKVLESEYA